jgi:hypothetical protein
MTIIENLREKLSAILDGFEKRMLLEEKQKNEQGYNPNYADINGIKLKRKNENKSMKSLTCKEALKVARRRGLRFPTTAEWDRIFELGSTWDDEGIGTWIGANHALKAETDLSTFLPAEGFWYYSSVGQCRQRNDDGFSVRCVYDK